MVRTLLAVLIDVVAGLVVAGFISALVVTITPVRPNGQAWLWLLAVASAVAVGMARRRLVVRRRRHRPPSSTRTSPRRRERRG